MSEQSKSLKYNVLTDNELRKIESIWQADFSSLIDQTSSGYDVSSYFKNASVAYLALQEANNLAKELTTEGETSYQAMLSQLNEILYASLTNHKLLSHAILAFYLDADDSYPELASLLSLANTSQLALLCLAYSKQGYKQLYSVYLHYLSLVFKESLTRDKIITYLKFLAVLAFNFNSEETNALYRELQYIYYRYQDEANHHLWSEDETVLLEAVAIDSRLVPFYEQLAKTEQMIAKQLDLFS